MSTASSSPQQVRPMDIPGFCEKLLDAYKPSPAMYGSPTASRVRRVVAFLKQHPSLKTTDDLKASLIAEFAGTCGDLSQSYQVALMMQFRKICGLAVEWGYLERNPFDGYQPPGRPSARPFKTLATILQLDEEEFRKILSLLEAGAGTWKGHRLYAFTRLVIVTRLNQNDIARLTTANYDPGRDPGAVLIFDAAGCRTAVRIPTPVKEVMAKWFPRRSLGDRAPQTRYGWKLGADGRALVPDETEQGIIARICRMRSEKYTLEEIARELDRLRVPTKRGRRSWSIASVGLILERETSSDSGVPVIGGEGRKRERLESEPDWIFPSIGTKTPGNGPWSAKIAGDRLQAAGKSLGIKGLTFEALRRFHREHTRTTVDFPAADVDQVEGGPSPPPVVPHAPGECPVEMCGPYQPPIVGGMRAPRPLSPTLFDILTTMVFFHRSGKIRNPESAIAEKSGRSEPIRAIKKMVKKDPFWEPWFSFPGVNGRGGYGLKWPDEAE